MSIEQIEFLTKAHAQDRELLAARVQALHDELETIKRRKLPGIKGALSVAKDSRLKLEAAIKSERALFDRPRTRVFHGIKVGLQKAKGKLSFSSAEQVVALIRKHFAEQFDALVKVTEKPVKSALMNLPASDLKKLGCTVERTGDEVVIDPTDSDIDKLVDALLDEKSSDDSADEEAA